MIKKTTTSKGTYAKWTREIYNVTRKEGTDYHINNHTNIIVFVIIFTKRIVKGSSGAESFCV